TLDVNLTGAWLCTKHAAPHLRESDCAAVVNVSSVGGKRPYPNRAAYAASKAGLVGLTRTLAFELGVDDVTVNAVCPGPVSGERIQRAIQGQAELADEDVRVLDVDPGDFALQSMTVEQTEVAGLVAFLLGPEARSMTAQDVNLDGGLAWY
ncbi:MAG: SDR family NAD(P)-dependent oxidoreductase, partial [Halobacteriales archaeon]